MRLERLVQSHIFSFFSPAKYRSGVGNELILRDFHS